MTPIPTRTSARIAAAEAGGRYTILKRVAGARISSALIRDLDTAFAVYARGEADRATRQWFAARRRQGFDDDELADLTLAHYERALRSFQPHFEIEFRRGRDEHTGRYRGAAPFLRWLERRRGINLHTLNILFATPGIRVRVFLPAAAPPERAYMWGEGYDTSRLDALMDEITGLLRRYAGRAARFRAWPFSLAVAGLSALVLAAGLSFKLNALRYPWPTVLFAATIADVAAALILLWLWRRAWPIIYFQIPSADAGAARRRRGARLLYLLLTAAFIAVGGWALLTTFFRFVW